LDEGIMEIFYQEKGSVRKWNDNDWGEGMEETFHGTTRSKEMEVRQGERTAEVKRDMEEEIEVEVRRAIKKLKVKKAAGVNGIPMKTWKYVSSELVEELVDLIKTVWKQEHYRVIEKRVL